MDLNADTDAGKTTLMRVAVDMTGLRPGGENGGIKPFLFETLLWLGRQPRVPLQLVYLTCSRTHAEVRELLARVGDELVCVRDNGGPPPGGGESIPRERALIPPPLDLLWRLDVSVFYCPFGSVEFALPGIPTISTVVDVLHRDFPWSLSPHHNAARERDFQELLAVADAVQCNSEHVVSRLREHYGLALERTFTVYNAVHGRFASLPTQAGATRTTPFFFYPANAWKHKNHETLLLAYGMYRADAVAAGTVPWPLVLTGYEDERWAELCALAQTLGLSGEDSVRFMGYVPPPEFGRLWETAGALVFPSLHEGFGIPLLEAMQHGVPIVCGRDASLPEVGADACLYVDARRPEALAEAMTRLATDAPLRQRLVEAGRRRLRDFSQDQEAGRLLNVFVALSRTLPFYRPWVRGIFPDGWTEHAAMLALPAGPAGSIRARLTLRFRAMPAPRRVRLRMGRFAALGSFHLPPDRPDEEIALDVYADGNPLWMEILDAANLNPDDGRIHGVQLRAADLRLADGREYPLFAAR